MEEICPHCLDVIVCGYCSCVVSADPHLAKRDAAARRPVASRRRMRPDYTRGKSGAQGRRKERRQRR